MKVIFTSSEQEVMKHAVQECLCEAYFQNRCWKCKEARRGYIVNNDQRRKAAIRLKLYGMIRPSDNGLKATHFGRQLWEYFGA